MESNLLGDRLDDILRSALSDAGEELVVVNPTRDGLESLIDVASGSDDLPTVRVLAEERTLKDVMDDFIVASNAAVLIEDGVLEFRTVEDGPENALLVTDDRVVAIVDAGTQVAGLVSEEGEFVAAANERYEGDWDAAEEYSLRTPSIERVRETLSEDIGADAEEDFTNILASLETARGDGDGLDEVTISLLVAAKNEALLYDISKWGEDIGIASKATFSRTKTKLEDKGLLDTEKVPIDVGRPRLRLKLGDERLQGADNGELASAAQSLLA
ncbi:DUF5821 family protein [Salinarchaeum chitinilyticum]